MSNYYINKYNRAERVARRQLKTVDCKSTIHHTTNKVEAEYMLRRYVLFDPESVYYISSRPCKAWRLEHEDTTTTTSTP